MDLRIRRGSVAILLAVSVAAPGGVQARAATVAAIQPCTQLAASPQFATDHTAFCAGEVQDATTGNSTGIAFNATTDGGRTWSLMAATGLPPASSASSAQLDALMVSPTYGKDHVVILVVSNLLYESTDLGATFVLLGPAVSRSIAVYVPAGGATALNHASVVYAEAESTNNSEVSFSWDVSETVDAVTHEHTPVVATWGVDSLFAVSPSLTADGDAFVVSINGATNALYGCTMKFICTTRLWDVPASWRVDRLWLGPDFPAHRTLFASLVSNTTPPRTRLWRSLDGGKTFRLWKEAERLQPDYGQVSFGLAGVPGTRDLYLRISGNGDTKPNGTPYERLFHSNDDGSHWKLVSYGRSKYQKGPRGTMPPYRPYEVAYGRTPEILVARVGRLFMLGETIEGDAHVRSFFCSADGGRTWRRTC